MRTASQFANKQARFISSDIIGRTPIQRPEGEGHNARLRGNGRSPSNTCPPLPVLLRRTGPCRVPRSRPRAPSLVSVRDLRSGLFYPYYSKQAAQAMSQNAAFPNAETLDAQDRRERAEKALAAANEALRTR
jgi:hypothetical protein